MSKETTDRQPCYGMIAFRRINANSEHLYGSNIKHTDIIELEIRHGCCTHSNERDMYLGEEKIVKVELSSAQFAELITSLNMGEGVPCTITYTEKDGSIQPIEWIGEKERIQQDFEHEINTLKTEATDGLNEIINTLNTKNINLTTQRSIAEKLRTMSNRLYDSIPWIHRMFTESMERTQTQAISEVEARTHSYIEKLGLNALKTQQADSLIEQKKDE